MKILLLDTAFAAAPIYEYLVSSGHDVWVMGNRPLDLLARKAGHRWIQQDYSQIEAVENHIDRLGLEGVVPGCTDVSIETCLQLGLGADLRDSADTNRILANKNLFRELCRRLNLCAPRVVAEQDFPQPGAFICKPVDAFSGRGITVFDGNDTDALSHALVLARLASRSGEVLIETFVSGQLHSCSGFVRNGRIEDAFFVKEGSSANPYAVDTSFLVDDLPKTCVDALLRDLKKLSQHLELKDGLLHTQFLLSNDKAFIVEVARRCPGDLYPLLIEYSTGYAYAARYSSFFIGEPIATVATERRYTLRHTLAAEDAVLFGGLVCTCAQPVRAFFPLAQLGERLQPRQGSRAGILFCDYPNPVALDRAYEAFLSRTAYQLDTTAPHGELGI